MIHTTRIHITMYIDGVEHELVNRIYGGTKKCYGCVLADDRCRCQLTDYWIGWGELELAPCKVLCGIWKKKEVEK